LSIKQNAFVHLKNLGDIMGILNNKNFKKYLTLFVLGLAGSIIFRIPFLRENYYAAMQEAMNVSNAQLGLLMGVYGIINLILFLPGGWAADKFSERNLITISCLATGGLGLCFATFPSFGVILIIHALFAITTNVTFWSACVRQIRDLGDDHEQGKLFGIWNAVKGSTSAFCGFATVPLFAWFGEGASGLRAVILFYSVVVIITGIVCWFLLEDTKHLKEKGTPFKAKDMLEVIRMPSVWVAGLSVLCAWSIYIGYGMLTPYLSQVVGLGDSNVALLSALRANVLFALGGLIGGMLSDKFQSRIKFFGYTFIGMIIFTAAFLVIPPTKSFLPLIICFMIILGIFVYGALALYFAFMDELKVPKNLTGTATGVICIIGYAPDAFLYSLLGGFVDYAPGFRGYQYVFLYMILVGVIGFACTVILTKLKQDKEI
jgi:sugar phosphate permease